MAQILVRYSVPKKADARPEARYTARVRTRGVVKCKTFRTKTQAEDWAEKEESRIEKEAREGTLITGNYTVHDALEMYKEHQLEHIASTWENALNKLEMYLGTVKLADLRQAHILNARSKYRKSRDPVISNSACNKFTTCLRNVLRLARKFEMLAHDPFREFERLDEKVAVRNRYLKDDERKRLFEAVRQSQNPHLWAIVNMAIMTGFRKNTIRYLRWSNVDLPGGMIRLSKRDINEERKRGKPSCPNIPIVPALSAILKTHKMKYGSYEFVFPSPVDSNRPIDFRTAWEVAVKRAKLDDFAFHDLRHTTGTYLGRMKVPLHIIQQILGHSDPKMSMRYITTVDEAVSSEMARVFDFIKPTKDGTGG